MEGVTYPYIEQYLRNIIEESPSKLLEIEAYAEINHIPIISKEVSQLLKFLINIKRPNKILELGTAIGYSAISMAIFSDNKAHITTIERDEKMVEKAIENIEKFELKDNIKIIEGECLEVLESLNDRYDFVFIDAGKGHYNHFHPHCMRLLNKDGIIVADNVLFRGMLASKDLVKRRKITIVKRMRKYIEEITHDKSLIVSILPMSDGIALIYRR
ncbi:MAG: O-methyltransferase [Oscillospiraceae bacterium]|nr:O-methyltransferase [Oscillospiraceae bacterium]